jgi:DNA-binding MarR family transcriptional regulator
MAQATPPDELINDFLGNAHIFSSVIRELMKRYLREAGNGEITYSQLRLLKLVALARAETVRDVAALLGISSAAASKTVDKLVRRGVLRRDAEPGDRRVTRLSLTETGEELLESYDDAWAGAMREIFNQFSSEDVRRTTDLLALLSTHIVHEGPFPGEDYCFRCGIYFPEHCLLRDLSRRTCYYHRYRRENGTGNGNGERENEHERG